MKRLSKVLTLSTIIIICFTLAGCSSNDTLVGTWRRDSSTSDSHQIIFLENGSGEITNLDTGTTNSFTWSEGSLIPFAFSERLGIEFYEYEIDGDTLRLTRVGMTIGFTFMRQ